MRKNRCLLLTMLLIILSAALTVGASKNASKLPGQVWEYKIVTLGPDSHGTTAETELDQLGAEGWELVSVAAWHDNYFMAYLKRAK